MPKHHGCVLTQVYSLAQLFDCQRRGKHNAVKLVTGWGLASGWTPETRRQALHSVPTVIVRSVNGDPSYADGSRKWPVAHELVAEFAQWYALRPDVIFEVGNEPNISKHYDARFVWGYRWHLLNALGELRRAFPKATFCAPALIMGAEHHDEAWLDVCADAFARFDYIGLHAYEYHSITRANVPARTGHFQRAYDLHARFGQPWLLTEYGINDPKTSAYHKGQGYAAALATMHKQVEGAWYYHLCVAADVHPEYHVYPLGDDAYGAGVKAQG